MIANTPRMQRNSLLMTGALPRLLGALALIMLLWAAVIWAVHSGVTLP